MRITPAPTRSDSDRRGLKYHHFVFDPQAAARGASFALTYHRTTSALSTELLEQSGKASGRTDPSAGTASPPGGAAAASENSPPAQSDTTIAIVAVALLLLVLGGAWFFSRKKPPVRD